jgi:23S rRNA pseudouridine1911/1915/1917 synthase
VSERAPLRPRRFTQTRGGTGLVVPPYAAHQRLDAFLTRFVGERSRSDWQRLIGAGAVTVNGRRLKPSERVRPGDLVSIDQVPAHVELRPAQNIPLVVVYEDPAMIVLDKPPGLVVHPAPGHEEGTLVNALLAHFPELRDPTGEQRPGIVHRLDKDTSGLMVVGRTAAAMAQLQQQFRERTATKRYLLLLKGDLVDEEAAIDVPIARDPRDRKRMAPRHGGREARTEFHVLERFGSFTLVEASLLSGRTHQLRVHFQYLGHPVAGDQTYGRAKGPPGLRRQFVHAAYLKLRSPHDGDEREFQAELPPDLADPLNRLRAARPRPPLNETPGPGPTS